jgi:homoserine O-acetyltransferase
MTQSDSIPAPGNASSRAESASGGQGLQTRDAVLEIPGVVRLHHGGTLQGVRVAWRLSGPAQAPIIAVLGGISGGRRVYSTDDTAAGWWHEVAGPGLALPAEHFRMLAFDYLGGSGDTTGPHDGAPFPSVSTYDQAEILLRLMNHLGIKALRGIVGASYGGMVALAFAERYPDRVSQLVLLSAADRTHPMSTAWRSVQRRIVRLAREHDAAREGLVLARALALSTYRSQEEFAARFSGSPRATEQGFVFPVEEYLMARGKDYAKRYGPDGFMCLSESIDLHRVDASRIFVPTTAVAVREDQLVPLADMRAMVARLPNAKLHEISSVFGHDMFLKEPEQLKPIFARALGTAPQATP